MYVNNFLKDMRRIPPSDGEKLRVNQRTGLTLEGIALGISLGELSNIRRVLHPRLEGPNLVT